MHSMSKWLDLVNDVTPNIPIQYKTMPIIMFISSVTIIELFICLHKGFGSSVSASRIFGFIENYDGNFVVV